MDAARKALGLPEAEHFFVSADTRAYRKVNDRTIEVTVKKNGKVIVTARSVVSADGKTRTSTVSGTTAKGKKFNNVAVYDKQ